MRRWSTAEAEIGWRGYEALAKMILPDAVDHHAGREVAGLLRHPAGQFQPAARSAWNREVAGSENFRHASRHDVARRPRVTTALQSRIGWRELTNGVGRRYGCQGIFFFQPHQFLTQ